MIENDLAQKMFQLFYNMARVANWDLLPMMSKSEYILLRKINNCQMQNHRLTLSQIAQELKLSSPAISRTVKNVEAKQWIVREIDEDDRRNSFIELTALGSEEITKANAIIYNLMNESLNKVGEEEVLAFFETGDKIYQAIGETLAETVNKSNK
ncbi:MarR family winged helix-turn-helix transcriptional regulator [Fundicoccus sp. Sow4_D5]|uniref:MarR family winged helix-turn-helix transcriptional regulator n=1 Tax=unclassified Fundicoccus TaxID=2761543 RepID=UPI003F8DB27E